MAFTNNNIIEYYKKGATVPVDTTADSDKIITSIGGMSGAIEIRMRIDTETVISAADSLTLTVKSENEAGNVTRTHFSKSWGTGTYAVGADYVVGVIPSDALYKTYVSYATDDVAAVGKIDIYHNYLPR